MRLYDIAFVCRSKNAGPFHLTIDLMFTDRASFDRVLHSPAFTPETIAGLYRTDASKVMIKPFERILTIKAVIPRLHGSGSAEDTDVYGSQQHFPLGALEL